MTPVSGDEARDDRSPAPPPGFVLGWTTSSEVADAALELRREGGRPGSGTRCDLSAVSLRGGAAEARGMPVVRAVGDARRVVDATSGLLGDAFLLAAAGIEVLALERSPIVHALAADGLRRALGDRRLASLVGGRITLVEADAIPYLASVAGTDAAPDAVLLDPMFPPKRRRSALPRKEMATLRELVGSDPDAAELLAAARNAARSRVVLKRSDDAPQLGKADWSVAGTTVRFDVFRPASD